MIDIIYRLSDNGYKKPKFPNATKQHCWENAHQTFIDGGRFHLFVDNTNLTSELRKYIEKQNDRGIDPLTHFEYYTGGSSAGSWRHVFEYALYTLNDDNIVYFLEDDYLHLPRSNKILLEGLDRADYVTLYLHGDRFIPASKGGNKFVDDSGSYVTRILKTDSCFWTQVESTTMTFATKIKTLKEDLEIWNSWTMGNHPNDFMAFMELAKSGRTLIAPIPTYATHCEPIWQSPLIGTRYTSWDEI